MFDNLSDKLQRVFKNLRGEGKLTPENMESALREIRVALLEADVNFRVVKQLIENIKQKAMGEEVLMSLSPSQQVIKIVRDELIKIMGSHESKLRFSNEPPSVLLIVGLQGSGKTTSTGKLARWLSKNGHRPPMVSVDVYRPAAREQLRVVARDVNLPIYTGAPEETLPDAARRRETCRAECRTLVRGAQTLRAATITDSNAKGSERETNRSAERLSIARAVASAKRNPLSPEDLIAEDRRLAAYGARQAKKLDIKEEDAVRLVHESRKRRPAS